jgi:hypothetical protein
LKGEQGVEIGSGEGSEQRPGREKAGNSGRVQEGGLSDGEANQSGQEKAGKYGVR